MIGYQQRNPQQRPDGKRSWLSALEEGKAGGGMLKPGVVRNLVILGLLVVLGLSLMGLPDLLRRGVTSGSIAGTESEEAASPPGGGLGGYDGAGAVAGAGPGTAPTAGSAYMVGVADLAEYMERKLEETLSLIEGAGKVSVAVFLESGATYVYGYDERESSERTEERDAQGGTRVVTQTDTDRSVVTFDQGSQRQPVVVKVVLPPIRGVVVVAPGARDSRVKALLSQAVQTLYGVPAHKVIVLAGSGG